MSGNQLKTKEIMKVNTTFIIDAIEERKQYLTVLIEGQMNDLDEKAAEFTRTVIVGLDEALALIYKLSIKPLHIRRASQILSADGDENEIIKMLVLIITDYRLPEIERESVIDYIDGVDVWERMGWKLTSKEFLEEIHYI